LLDASIKLAGDGGRVEVATARTDTHVMATVAQAGGPACARRPETGLAIGLAVAGQLAERHGGRLETETAAADGGTCFALHLPYRPPAAQDTVP
jgi:signal transduction histidine kinase